MKRKVMEKVYKVQELARDQRTKYDSQIAELKGQLASVKDILEEFRTTMGQLVTVKS